MAIISDKMAIIGAAPPAPPGRPACASARPHPCLDERVHATCPAPAPPTPFWVGGLRATCPPPPLFGWGACSPPLTRIRDALPPRVTPTPKHCPPLRVVTRARALTVHAQVLYTRAATLVLYTRPVRQRLPLPITSRSIAQHPDQSTNAIVYLPTVSHIGHARD